MTLFIRNLTIHDIDTEETITIPRASHLSRLFEQFMASVRSPVLSTRSDYERYTNSWVDISNPVGVALLRSGEFGVVS